MRTTIRGYTLMRWLPAVAWLAVIFAFSSIPGDSLPSTTIDLTSVAHVAEYAILATLLVFAVGGRRVTIALALALLLACSLYGVTDEFHQSFVPGRTPDPIDWAMDTAGAAAAIGVLAVVRKRRP